MNLDFYRRRKGVVTSMFGRETTGHELTIVRDDGPYRHLRVDRPAKLSTAAFEIVTWPRRVAVSSGYGGYILTVPDGDPFWLFRESRSDGINPGYWAEWAQADSDYLFQYDEDLLRHLILKAVHARGDRPAGLMLAIQERVFCNGTSSLFDEADARDIVASFNHHGFKFCGVWDWDLRFFTWSWMWTCCALLHGIGLYDAAKAAGSEAVA